MSEAVPYIENPKTKGSGIICAIPQTGVCPVGCADCFFQSGRSYLEPLDDNLPNMPPNDIATQIYRVVRVNDGNDSSVDSDRVVRTTTQYPRRFYNTSYSHKLCDFPGPVVLTVNPGEATDVAPTLVDDIPTNLMFVRVRTNVWNRDVVDATVEYYTKRDIPIVLTFMAYWGTADEIPNDCRESYKYRKRTLNSYWAIRHEAWREIMDRYQDNPLVHSCGTEDISGGSACKNCGNCLREYFATVVRMGKDD